MQSILLLDSTVSRMALFMPRPSTIITPDTRLHDQSHPLWPPMAMTSLEQMPPLPGPVTSITAPFYDASFRCQVCLQLTEEGGRGYTE